jgi:TPR repeat protein
MESSASMTNLQVLYRCSVTIALGSVLLTTVASGSAAAADSSIERLRVEAADGKLEAQKKLAYRLLHGDGVAIDRQEAARLLKVTAARGDAWSCYMLAYESQFNGLGALDEAGILRHYELAAEQNYPLAPYALGNMYAQGLGVTANHYTAFAWFKKSADLGDESAHYVLGLMYQEGDATPVDERQAVVHFRAAAEKGVALAQYSLGSALVIGRGVKTDFEEAAHWLALAADQGEPRAQYVLGGMYVEGTGVPADAVKGMRLIRLAAEQNYRPAIVTYELFRTLGIRGVKKKKK